MIYLALFVWWLIGYITWSYIRRDGVFTWGDLVSGLFAGFLGLILPLSIVLDAFITWAAYTDFWSHPVFHKNKTK